MTLCAPTPPRRPAQCGVAPENYPETRGPGGVGLVGEIIIGLRGTRDTGGDEQDHVRFLLIPRVGRHGITRGGQERPGLRDRARRTGERTAVLPARVHDEKVTHGADLPVGLVQRGA